MDLNLAYNSNKLPKMEGTARQDGTLIIPCPAKMTKYKKEPSIIT